MANPFVAARTDWPSVPRTARTFLPTCTREKAPGSRLTQPLKPRNAAPPPARKWAETTDISECFHVFLMGNKAILLKLTICIVLRRLYVWKQGRFFGQKRPRFRAAHAAFWPPARRAKAGAQASRAGPATGGPA